MFNVKVIRGFCESFVVFCVLCHLLTFCATSEAAALVAGSSFNCSDPPKFESFDISKCCRLPSINLGPAVEKCHNQIRSLKSHNPQFPVYAHVCYPECIYRETGSFIDGEIHMETVKNFLQTNVEQHDKIIVPTIVESFQICMTNIKNTMQAKNIKSYPNIEGLGCSPYASMVYGCVNAETFLHCPPEMWQNEQTCNLAKNFALQCNPLPHVPMPVVSK